MEEAGLVDAEDRSDDDTAEDHLVVQVRALRPLPGDLPEPSKPAILGRVDQAALINFLQ
jgi:hypothetical protein